jgi:hypothetical protein
VTPLAPSVAAGSDHSKLLAGGAAATTTWTTTSCKPYAAGYVILEMNNTNHKTKKSPQGEAPDLNPVVVVHPVGIGMAPGLYNKLMDVWPSRRRRRRSSSNCLGRGRMRPQRSGVVTKSIDHVRIPLQYACPSFVRRRRHIRHGPSVEEWVGRSCSAHLLGDRVPSKEKKTRNCRNGFSRSNRGISLPSAAIAPAGTAQRETAHRQGPHTVCGCCAGRGRRRWRREITLSGPGPDLRCALPPSRLSRSWWWVPQGLPALPAPTGGVLSSDQPPS